MNLDLTNAQPAPGVMTATHNVSLSIPPARRTCRGYVHRNTALTARVGVAVTWLNLIDLHALLCLTAPTPCMMHSTHASSRLTPCRLFVEKIFAADTDASVSAQVAVQQRRSQRGVSSTTVWLPASRSPPTTAAAASSSNRASRQGQAVAVAWPAVGRATVRSLCLRVGCRTASPLCQTTRMQGCCWHWVSMGTSADCLGQTCTGAWGAWVLKALTLVASK